MKPTTAALALALTAGSVQAQVDGFSSRAELLGYWSSAQSWSRSAFNRIASVADHSNNLEFRPDLSWSDDSVAASLKPRFAARVEPGARHSDSWLNEGWLRWRPASGISLQAGREALLWGPGAFWNPSNPFFADNNKANAKRETSGHDFLRGRWQISDSSALSLISQLGSAHTQDTPRRRDAIKFDWLGNEASASVLVSAEPQHAADWQGWLQWTASDALLVYGEAGWRGNGSQQRAHRAATPTGWQIDTQDNPRHLDVLVGAAWTFESNWTLTGELWRNGGLEEDDARSQAQAVDALASAPRGLADQQLASLLSQASPMRRHYAGLQLINGSDARIGWTLRYKQNLDDHSGEAFVMLKRDLGDQWQVWANLMLRHGSKDSEYGRWIQRSAMLGLSWFMW